MALETVQNPARYNEILRGPKSKPPAASGADATKGAYVSYIFPFWPPRFFAPNTRLPHVIDHQCLFLRPPSRTHTRTGLIARDAIDLDFPSILKRLTEEPLSSSSAAASPSMLSSTQAPPPTPATEEQGGPQDTIESTSTAAVDGLGGGGGIDVVRGGPLAVNDPGVSTPPAKHGAVWPFRARA